MEEQGLYQIGELAERAVVTPRTIRYYTAEGLLPPPETRGKYALYSEEHLLRLQLIGRLKDAYLPLNTIKARLEGLDAPELRRLLSEAGPAPQRVVAESASEYIAQLLRGEAQVPLPAAALQAAPKPPQPATPMPAPAARARGIAQPLPPVAAVVPAEQDGGDEQWRRVVLAPGAELHIRETLAQARREQVDQLVAQARALFG